MRKYFFSILTVLVLASSINFAQFKNIEKTGGLARIQSMGESPFLIDPYMMTFNPAWSALYTNFIWGDIGADNGVANNGVGQFLGANFKVVPGFTLGAILSRNDFQAPNFGVQIANINPVNDIDPNHNFNFDNFDTRLTPLNNNLEVLGSFSLSNNLHLGFGVSYASTSFEDTPPTGGGTTVSASQFGVNAGLLASFNGIGIDLGVAFVAPGGKIESPVAANGVDLSQTVISVSGRAFIPLSSKFQLVPLATFTTASGTIENGTTSTDLPSATQIGVGLGMNYNIENILLTGGVSFANVSITRSSTQTVPEVSNSYMAFPVWNLGAEWNFTEWLTGRLGYVATQGSATTQTPVTTTTVGEHVQTFYDGNDGFTLGLGFKFKQFSLSATVNERVLHEGLNNIGGGTPTLGYLSASIAF